MQSPDDSILIVEDDPSLRLLCRVNLELEGYRVREAANVDEARRELAAARPLMLEPPSRERWLEAVGEGILDGPIADEVEVMPSEEVRVPFALQGSIGTLAGPYDPGTAFVAFYHELGEAVPGRPGAWGFARGGMGSVTAALRAAAEAAGARVHLGTSVVAIRPGAVVLDDGREVAARAVLSNADPARTAALADVDPPVGWSQPGPVVKVMLLLDGLPDFPSWPNAV